MSEYECAKNKISDASQREPPFVTFVNGVRKVYDCHELLKLDRFQLLQHKAFFKAVTVDAGGYGVSWDDERDLSEYELWHNGVEVEQDTA
ncbi:DUF2442 domain-containing protein [candidate division KSB1 bacterium]|nr:DUF2442 domain-containing protein [candidate division KSB1 bacterium]